MCNVCKFNFFFFKIIYIRGERISYLIYTKGKLGKNWKMSLKFSGDVRNDLYLTLEKGDFEKGGKSTGKNIEATVYLVNSEGLTLEVKKIEIL